jgi:hypothetical protein
MKSGAVFLPEIGRFFIIFGVAIGIGFFLMLPS